MTTEKEKSNIAFKCNYCNGGFEQDKQHYGFNGVCTPGVIEHNIKKMKYEWCSLPRCACARFYNGEFTYDQVWDEFRSVGSVCYESVMLNKWEALAGWDTSGKRGERPRKILGADLGSLAVLSLVTPNSMEYERRIFALFLIDDYFAGDDENEGYVACRSQYRLHFTRKETNDLRFWNYYSYENTDKRKWGSGLFRYLTDEQSARILHQAMLLKRGTPEATISKDIYERFCMTKGLNNTDIKHTGMKHFD